MKKLVCLFSCFLCFTGIHAQKISLNGLILDEEKKPLPYATVSILKTDDSTLLHYGITNENGQFEIKGISPAMYLFQAAAYGYKTVMAKKYFSKDSTCLVQLEPASIKLNEVTVEVAPVLIKKDTIEYNSAAFKTRPDANAEELLKKLPGVEVDRNGNVKAQGENVSKVLVDGKEFFGDDPKVATKNLPADAIKKVQVFDKKSEDAELTGIDDGSNQKVINLVLKDGKKSAVLGDVMAGYGTDNHYQAAAKAYRFKKQSQFAALGMINNVNQFGFTLTDYLSFSGGLRSLSDGDGLGSLLNNNSSLPVNFGQPVTGLIESGAAGINYTYEKSKGKRFNVSYMGNGSRKNLYETTFSQNFTNNSSYTKYDSLNDLSKNMGNNFQLNWKNRIDTTQNVSVRLNASYGRSKLNSVSTNFTFAELVLANTGKYGDQNNSDQLNTSLSLSYLRRLYSKWRLFKVDAGGGYDNNNSNINTGNTVSYTDMGLTNVQDLFQRNNNIAYNSYATLSFTRRLPKAFYLDAGAITGMRYDAINRLQGVRLNDSVVDSLSPNFSTTYGYVRPFLTLKKNTEKTEFQIQARAELSSFVGELNQETNRNTPYAVFIPGIFWEREYKSQRRVSVNYESILYMPQLLQLLPVANTLNPLQVYTGNGHLKPEYVHSGDIRWWIFDQFSMTTMNMSLRGTYTQDKISYARTIDNFLNQQLTTVNVKDDYRVDAGINYSTPIRKLKINVDIRLNESYNRGLSLVNGITTVNTNYTHSGSVSFNNRKKDKWDVNTGASVRYTQTYYNLQSNLNNSFYNYGGFAEISYTPNNRFNFFVTGDITSYNGSNFKQTVLIPLLKAEVKYYFLKHQRGILSLEAFDLLNKNTGVQRVSELNYIMERNSNIIQQYFMLSFKYKLSKFDVNQGMNIEINGKR